VNVIAFEAFINGRRLCRAGVGEDGTTLYACLTWIADIKAHSGKRGPKGARGVPFLLLEGRSAKSYKAWPQVALAVGDQVRLRIVDAIAVDPPSHEQHDSDVAAAHEKWEKQFYLRLKRKYGSRGVQRGTKRPKREAS
jgi:hypothetical protein